MTPREKAEAAAMLFLCWLLLVLLGKADSASLVDGIKWALVGLGVFAATMAQPPGPPGPNG